MSSGRRASSLIGWQLKTSHEALVAIDRAVSTAPYVIRVRTSSVRGQLFPSPNTCAPILSWPNASTLHWIKYEYREAVASYVWPVEANILNPPQPRFEQLNDLNTANSDVCSFGRCDCVRLFRLARPIRVRQRRSRLHNKRKCRMNGEESTVNREPIEKLSIICKLVLSVCLLETHHWKSLLGRNQTFVVLSSLFLLERHWRWIKFEFKVSHSGVECIVSCVSVFDWPKNAVVVFSEPAVSRRAVRRGRESERDTLSAYCQTRRNQPSNWSGKVSIRGVPYNSRRAKAQK